MIDLLGHDDAITAFRSAMADGRLHHAWLLTGPQGIGKARFADAAALRLLAEAAGPPIAEPGIGTPDDHPIAHLIRAGSHPDFRRLERLPRDKGPELARNITIAQVRALQGLFGSTPSLSAWRAVVIDAVDDLERGAANALLKNLEEPPPKCLFLLVSHAPGKLLPTIRSRCRLLRFPPLGDDDMRAALGAALPAAPSSEIDALVLAGGGAPGRALRYAGLDIAALDAALGRLTQGGAAAGGERSKLAKSLSSKAAQARYEAFLERAPAHAAMIARTASGPALAAALAVWEKARALAESAVRLSLDPQTTVFELAGLLATLAPDVARDHG